MLSPNLGKKRRCSACDAPFYDLNRDPIICPKCGAVHQPVARLKSDGREPPRGRTFARREPLRAEAVAPTTEAAEPLDDDLKPDSDPADEDAGEDADEQDHDEEDSSDGPELEPDPDEPSESDRRR